MLKIIRQTFAALTPARRRDIAFFIVLGFILSASIVRIKLYGDPHLSIAGNDTQTYVDASRVPLSSSEIMTGRRLLTTNLVYKFFEPEDGYQVLVNGSLETTRRAFQPGFDGIVIFQLILSIVGWGALAFMVASYLKQPLMKILSAALVILFAFTPQMADWDSILMSESLTFSLFALQLALLIRIAFALYEDPNARFIPWLIAWAVVFFFWTFLRDTNLVASVITALMIAGVLISLRYRRNKALYGGLVFLATVVVLGMVTAGISIRSIVQLRNLYKDDIFVHESRVAIFQEMGMPADDLYDPEFEPWLAEHGAQTVFRFMLAYPGYPLEKLVNDFPSGFQEIKQTYFNAPEIGDLRQTLMDIGDTLHPETPTPFLLSGILLIGLLLLAMNNVSTSRPWAWLGLWLFLTATLTLIPTILGDTWALNRHALFSSMIYRLFMWLFAIVIMDIALDQDNQTPAVTQ